ncbi:pantetheine-phosphate adenylyltransferase [Pseudokineococcus sp. 1T1Z-3]|uniref:pantetheine-phosphate adenylyltransferase n=1 Tax=Pseudokineococcus sp. 1T1Z-3 TaxID=3132745 RepID=UPI0030961C59
MTTAACPGSFDPVTHGHLDVVARTAALFDDVVVLVVHNPGKAGLLTPEHRVALLEEVLPDALGEAAGRVRVEPVPGGLLVDACRRVGAACVVKGVRGGADVDAETPMALMNRHLSGLETLLLPGDPRWQHVASSLVREVARLGGDVADLVPAPVAAALREASERSA